MNHRTSRAGAWWRLASAMLAAAVSVPALGADRSPQEWLRRMADAMNSTNYAGTFVYRYGDQLEAMRIVHRAGGAGHVRERLISLNGVAREIIRDDDKVTCIFPDSHAVMVDRRTVRNPLSDLLPEDTDSLDSVYRLSVVGDGRVAGRDVVRISIEPMDRFRYGYELAIGRKHGLLLRSDLLTGDGEPVEQIMFTEIETPARIPDDWLEPTMSGEGFTWYRQQEDGESPARTESDWRVAGLPTGFRMTMQRRHSLPGRDVMVEHRLYSDGLANVSVYIERTGDKVGAFHGQSRMGAINAFGRTIGSYQIVVVGEVPAKTVERIGASIERRSGADGS